MLSDIFERIRQSIAKHVYACIEFRGRYFGHLFYEFMSVNFFLCFHM